jgi:hypothetical protein
MKRLRSTKRQPEAVIEAAIQTAIEAAKRRGRRKFHHPTFPAVRPGLPVSLEEESSLRSEIGFGAKNDLLRG